MVVLSNFGNKAILGNSPQRREDSVFLVLIVNKLGFAVGSGTGFFLTQDGLAMTDSHVTWYPVHEPGLYRVVAIYKNEFYDVNVLCSSDLDAVPNGNAVHLQRDLAFLRVTPESNWDGEPIVNDQERYLPGSQTIFPGVPLIERPENGELVTVIGFPGGHNQVVDFEGRVVGIKSIKGGEGEYIDFAGDRPGPGASGGLVVGQDGAAVGIWTWHFNASHMGVAQILPSFLSGQKDVPLGEWCH